MNSYCICLPYPSNALLNHVNVVSILNINLMISKISPAFNIANSFLARTPTCWIFHEFPLTVGRREDRESETLDSAGCLLASFSERLQSLRNLSCNSSSPRVFKQNRPKRICIFSLDVVQVKFVRTEEGRQKMFCNVLSMWVATGEIKTKTSGSIDSQQNPPQIQLSCFPFILRPINYPNQ